MVKIKKFPLDFTEDFLNEIGRLATGKGETKKEFILKAIKKSMEEEKAK